MSPNPTDDNDDNERETLSGDEVVDEIRDLDSAIDNFTAILSRIEHGHGPQKSLNNDDDDDDDDDRRNFSNHDLRGRFNVRDDFVKSHLFSQTNDHLAVYEMGRRADEFSGKEAAIFRDIDDSTPQSKIDARWDEIRSFAGLADGTTESAPTPPEAKKRLNKILEIRDEPQETLQEVPERVQEMDEQATSPEVQA